MPGHRFRLSSAARWCRTRALKCGSACRGASDPQYDLSVRTPWILASLIAYLVALALNLFVTVPAMRTAGVALEGAGNGGSGTSYPRIATSSGAVSLLLLLVVVLMVVKP